MWHLNGNLVVSLVHLSKNSKFCFFNNPTLDVVTIQRWGSTISSNNIEFTTAEEVDWKKIVRMTRDTMLAQGTSKL